MQHTGMLDFLLGTDDSFCIILFTTIKNIATIDQLPLYSHYFTFTVPRVQTGSPACETISSSKGVMSLKKPQAWAACWGRMVPNGLNMFLRHPNIFDPFRVYTYSPNMLKPAFRPNLQVIFDILLFLGIWKLKGYIYANIWGILMVHVCTCYHI